MKAIVLMLFGFAFAVVIKAEDSILLTSPVIYKVMDIRISGGLSDLERAVSDNSDSAIFKDAKEHTKERSGERETSTQEGSRSSSISTETSIQGGAGVTGVKPPEATTEISVQNDLNYRTENQRSTESGREQENGQSKSQQTKLQQSDLSKFKSKDVRIHCDVAFVNVSTNTYFIKENEVIKASLQNGNESYQLKCDVEDGMQLKPNGGGCRFDFWTKVDDFERAKKLSGKDNDDPTYKERIKDKILSQLVMPSGLYAKGFNGVAYPNNYENESRVFFTFGMIKNYSPFYIRSKVSGRSVSINEALGVVENDYSTRLRPGEICIKRNNAGEIIGVYDHPLGKIYAENKIILVLRDNQEMGANRKYIEVDCTSLNCSLREHDVILVKEWDIVDVVMKDDLVLTSRTLKLLANYLLDKPRHLIKANAIINGVIDQLKVKSNVIAMSRRFMF